MREKSPDTQKHTPGPWTFGSFSYGPYQWEITNTNLQAIAVVWTKAKMATQPFTIEPTAEGEANARLIAAAPTMYVYLANKAGSGDTEAQAILEVIHGRS